MASRFDPSSSIAFDLGRGRIALRGAPERVLIPADALVALSENAGVEAARDFGQRLGTDIGRRTLDRLGSAADASVEAVVEHLGGDLALMGFGSLGVEVWGRALVFTVKNSPFGAPGDALLGFVLEGALQRAFARDVGVLRLSRDDASARFLATSRATAERARGWLADGTAWGEVLTRLARPLRGEA